MTGNSLRHLGHYTCKVNCDTETQITC